MDLPKWIFTIEKIIERHQDVYSCLFIPAALDMFGTLEKKVDLFDNLTDHINCAK